jgi:hypothetical protein
MASKPGPGKTGPGRLLGPGSDANVWVPPESMLLLGLERLRSTTPRSLAGAASAWNAPPIQLQRHGDFVSTLQAPRRRFLIRFHRADSICEGGMRVERLACERRTDETKSPAIGLRIGGKTMAEAQTEAAAGSNEPVTITVQNLSSVLTEEQAQAITAALDVQATRDYNGSAWITDDRARPVGKVEFVAREAPVPDGTWHIELLDSSPEEGALGFHEDVPFKQETPSGRLEKASSNSQRGRRKGAAELPLAKIFCKTTQEAKEQPSEVASHEMLEMLVDPKVVPDPRTVTDQATQRIYPVEVCDPVQQSGGEIDGVLVSNFVTPAYFRLPQSNTPTQYDWYKVLDSPVPAMTRDGYLSFAPVSEPSNWQQEFGSSAG